MNAEQKDLKSEIQANDSVFDKMTDEEKIDVAAMCILERYRPAFEELAK